MKLEKHHIDGLIRKYIREALDDDEEFRAVTTRDRGAIEAQIAGYDMHQDECRDALVTGRYHKVSPLVDEKILKPNNIKADKESPEYQLLCRECLKADIKVMGIARDREMGIYRDQQDTQNVSTQLPEEPSNVSAAEGSGENENLYQGKTLSEVREVFISENQSAGSWTTKTQNEIVASLQVMIDFFGDIPVKSITREMMSDYKQAILRLPPNMNKDKRYRDKTIHEILAGERPEKTIKTHTINKLLGRASTLFEYATIHGYMSINPAKGMKVKANRRNTEARETLSIDDLNRIFGTNLYRDDTFRRSYMFWCPILAMFTGARVNEISQLYLSDFQKHDGIWCINFNDEGEKTLKPGANKRLVPLHPFLVDDLGIIQRVEQLKARGYERFMYDLPKASSGGYGGYVSRWFNERYKKDPQVNLGERKTFHSFRHTFGTNLSHNGINDHSLKALMGHSEKGVTFDTYVKKRPVHVLYRDLVDHLDYTGVDLEHLRDSKWVNG
ncbi:MAG: site-specific integrase [Desulfotignum sp.]|nr:site-specific integrase [Desulfotignum sp.]MCF8087190.1 site-specific integrase [Desulfotignum sp.]MCF8138349.1 site-specific integrase [Desulfotignum sp.]